MQLLDLIWWCGAQHDTLAIWFNANDALPDGSWVSRYTAAANLSLKSSQIQNELNSWDTHSVAGHQCNVCISSPCFQSLEVSNCITCKSIAFEFSDSTATDAFDWFTCSMPPRREVLLGTSCCCCCSWSILACEYLGSYTVRHVVRIEHKK